MSARQLPQVDYQAVKAATRQLVQMAGGASAAALVTRVAHQDISRYGSPLEDHQERFMPLDVVADIESECGEPVVTRALADLAGHILVPRPNIARSGSALGIITAKALKETSEVFVAIAESLGDGKLCAADVARIDTDIDEAIVKLMALRLQVQAEAEGAE